MVSPAFNKSTFKVCGITHLPVAYTTLSFPEIFAIFYKLPIYQLLMYNAFYLLVIKGCFCKSNSDRLQTQRRSTQLGFAFQLAPYNEDGAPLANCGNSLILEAAFCAREVKQ